jgi:sulfate adenylyltransferase subunit 2
MDVWQYIAQERIHLPSLYFSHEREVVERDGVLLATGEHNRALPDERAEIRRIRCRTIGDMTCTGVWESDAATLEEIIQEVAAARVTERGGRSDDKRSEAAMEDRKKQGYF